MGGDPGNIEVTKIDEIICLGKVLGHYQSSCTVHLFVPRVAKFIHLNILELIQDIKKCFLKTVLFKVASYLADFDTRWPHEYEIFNFARFSSRI